MSLVRVHNFAVSLDGFGTGEGQSFEEPFGHAGSRLLDRFLGTRTYHEMHGEPGGSAGADDAFASNWGTGIGAAIGISGLVSVFHTPVFVLTHHPRATLRMKGGTTFNFIDSKPAEALRIAQEAAGDLDVRIGGGPSTVRQFLAADLIDHMHIVIAPIVLGRGVRLWDGLEGLEERFDVEAVSTPSGVTHVTFTRR
jgi:dihydrofolate reductase